MIATPPSDADRHPLEIDTHAPRPERLYNHLLGGQGHFEVDQQLSETLDQHSSVTVDTVRANARALGAFVVRVVRYLAGEAGMRQFLCAGTAVPSGPTVHDVAQEVDPAVRVVYTSSDPVVLAHAHTLRPGTPEAATAVIHGSLRRRPEEVLARAAETLDFAQPIAVLLPTYLNFVPDKADPHRLVTRLLEAVTPGSYLVLAHSTSDVAEAVARDLRATVDHLTKRMGWPYVLRSRAEIATFLAGLELVEPGLVQIDQWRGHENRPIPFAEMLVPILGAVARKP